MPALKDNEETYFYIFRQIVKKTLAKRKYIAVTASTGIARLHFADGLTLHDWSGYGDGHMDINHLIQEMTVSAIYKEKKSEIEKCEVLIIDEIGMISAKMFSEVELICRTLRKSQSIFGGLQIIAAGSFVQLPPVPSVNDPGAYTFESPCFRTVFPHRIHLNTVHRQKDLDLVHAINELCKGHPSERTHKLMQSLKRPITVQDDTVFIFGTNYDVDFYNHMKLQEVNEPEVLFTADDVGEHINYKNSSAHKYVALKRTCKIVVTRNLYNGLVNGIGGTVKEMSGDSVKIEIDEEQQFKHNLSGRIFTVDKYTFTVRDKDNNVIGVRKQIPLKLGYTVTVHKAQGRTLNSVVVDSTHFWRPGQIGVAVGRATSKDALQITAYKKSISNLKHPDCVEKFYSERSLIMKQDLTCCNRAHASANNFLTMASTEIGFVQPCELEGNICEYLQNLKLDAFPFDIKNYVKELISKLPKLTQIQMDQVQILQDVADKESFQEFLCTAYTFVNDLFQKYKVANKKNKCNWCKMCAHLHSIFSSESYKDKVCKAFGTNRLKSNHNSICTRIVFQILDIVAEKEASDAKRAKMEKYIDANCKELHLDNLDKSTLRYIAGASLHSV